MIIVRIDWTRLGLPRIIPERSSSSRTGGGIGDAFEANIFARGFGG
jgi:hypothetical protein